MKPLLLLTLALLALPVETGCTRATAQKSEDERLDIPRYVPKDDYDAERHGHQPDFCTREGAPESKHWRPNCKCQKMCSKDGQLIEDHNQCRVSCRKDSCKCNHRCQS